MRARQADQHRRDLDDLVSAEHIRAEKVAWRNYHAWIARAQSALKHGDLDLAKRLIEQAEKVRPW